MTSLPRLIRPMLVSLRRELPADKESYGWELKWDGLRAIAYVSGEEVRLVSRNDKDMAPSYPELGVLAERVSTPVILDGEIVTLRDGRPDFGLLQSRMHVQQPDDKLLRRAPGPERGDGEVGGVFDLLLHAAPGAAGGPRLGRRPVRTPPWHRGGGAAVLAESIAKGLEGVVGKPLNSTYHPDQRRDWIKVKNVKQQEVIVCGWKPGEGRRADTIGSLLVGIYDGDQLRYVGHVGTGFTADMLADVMGQLGSLGREESPFGTKVPDQQARGARWVEPRLVGEVAFAEWTADGILRQPSWRGLRIDKEPGDVHREDPL
jgi:bifunctional non-homologous end joining protein LigD